MEGHDQSKSFPPSNDNESGRSLTGARGKCQLCGVASTKAIAGTSGGEDEFTASLEWFHVFLVGLDCLEERDKQLLNCSAADTCENCKSNLKFAKKHGERAVRQHEKVKRMFEEFTDELQILQEATGSAMFKLQKALGGPGLSQKEIPRAIGNAFRKFTGLQESTQEILSFLSSKFNGNFGLFPVPNIATDRDQQDLQQTVQVIKVESETETGSEASDMDENEQNVDPRITCAYSIAGCYVDEGSARNEIANSFAVKVEDGAYSVSNEADNQVVFLESSEEEEEGTADNQTVSLTTGKSKERDSQKNGKARKSAREQTKRVGFGPRLELGDEDCWSLYLLQSLGSAHRGTGKDKRELETALKMHQEAYQGLLEIGGEEDEYSINAKNEIALDLSMLGRHEEALQMFKENIRLLENLQRFPERLMEFKLNLVEGLERAGECLEEVLRQLEAIKEEFKNGGWKFSWQIKRVTDLINRVQEKMQFLLIA